MQADHEPDGTGPEDLAEVDRQAFRRALEIARLGHNPDDDWESFVDAAWHEAAPVFRIPSTT